MPILQTLMRTILGPPKPVPPVRERLVAAQWPAAIYAIGDVHGCLAELTQLEQIIYADGANIDGEKWIVMLGDYVDRGPDSAGVLDHLLSPPPANYRRVCLAGNHETLMIADFDAPSQNSDWLRFGGDKTLQSYAIDPNQWSRHAVSRRQRRQILDSHVPSEHVSFLRGLPVCLQVGKVVFVHAGLRHGVPLEQQAEQDLLWLRPDEDFPFEDDILVVHGHTPVATPNLSPWRIGIDTGAFATGILTAVRLSPNEKPAIFQVGN